MKPDSKKTILGTAAAVVASSCLLFGATQVVLAAQLSNKETVPTTYPAVHAVKQPALPEGYQKANYRAILEETDKVIEPTELDMGMEDAAETGVQALWKYFGYRAEGATVRMLLSQDSYCLFRTKWNGSILMENNASYQFVLDSVTGELFSVTYCPASIDGVRQEGYPDANPELMKKYAGFAQAVAEKLGLFPNQNVKYEAQGLGSFNDVPHADVLLTAEDGSRLQLTVGTLDGRLYGLSFDNALRESDQLDAVFQKAIESAAPSDSDKSVLVELSEDMIQNAIKSMK